MRMRIGAEGGMRGAGIGGKTETWAGLLQETAVCCPTCSEGFRCRARGDKHQEGSQRAGCRWRGTEGCLFNGGKGSAWSEKKRACSKVGNEKRGRGDGTEGHDQRRGFLFRNGAKFRGTAIVGIDAHINPAGTGKSFAAAGERLRAERQKRKRQVGM